jgi:ribosomal protein L7/L12
MYMTQIGFCKACKNKVSQDAKTCSRCSQPEPFQPLPDGIHLLVTRGNRIEAIKQLQELTGMDLKDSTEFVDGYDAQRRGR